MKPLGATAMSAEASDEQLVALAQAGSSEAFASLFRRYRPAIARYAGRLLGNDARVEDIVQEVFLSALRRIGSLDRPAGFKPWLYRIAHNTCVDHMRRTHRAEEVSIDANILPASEEIRLYRRATSTHAAVTQKEDFKNLREAFGGLPPSQSEVLVMRELEGLSYDQIAARMGITRASVESMLFRARQGLRDEYGQIATGERCLRMRPVMARMAEGMSGLRDRRALARHVRGCQSCRRDAFAMGLAGSALEKPVKGLRGGLSRVAALLPLPWLIHRRGDDPASASSASAGGGTFASQAQTAITQFTSTMGAGAADHAATAIHKAVAVVAAVAVVGGGGIVATKSRTDSDLLLKSGQTSAPARADVGPAVPSRLLPLTRPQPPRRRSRAPRPWQAPRAIRPPRPALWPALPRTASFPVPSRLRREPSTRSSHRSSKAGPSRAPTHPAPARRTAPPAATPACRRPTPGAGAATPADRAATRALVVTVIHPAVARTPADRDRRTPLCRPPRPSRHRRATCLRGWRRKTRSRPATPRSARPRRK